MFEDRTSNYDFSKLDQNARTIVITEQKRDENNMTQAQKTLFSAKQPAVKQPILNAHENVDVNSLPSSKYLQSFASNITVGEAEQVQQEISQETQPQPEPIAKEQSSINFEQVLNEANITSSTNKIVQKELKNITPAPKKNYSFRIKLVASVYCILVALFGGWVIGNSIDIINTNANIYNTVSETKEVEANIGKIVLKIKNFDDASKNPEDDSLMKEMIIESIDTTPEAIIEPNEYTKESNWFDVFCNWISGFFGG